MVEEPAAKAVADDIADAVSRAVDPDEILRFARALIAAPSENPGGTEDGAVAVAGDILAELDASAEVIRSEEDRPSLVARMGSGARPKLAWNGLVVVVPAGERSTWRQDPFEATVEGGRLIGRGAVDM